MGSIQPRKLANLIGDVDPIKAARGGHILADDRPRERFPLSGLLAAMASAQRESPRVRVILSGLPTLSLNLKRARTYAERMFRHAVVGNLEQGDAWDALGIPLAGSGRSFALSLIGDIVETTGGYPYFLQFVGAYLCRSITTPDVTAADYQTVEPALLHELDLAFFEDRFEGATPTEQRVLEAMAREPGQIRLTRLRPNVGDVAKPRPGAPSWARAGTRLLRTPSGSSGPEWALSLTGSFGARSSACTLSVEALA